MFATFMTEQLALAEIPWSINAIHWFLDYDTNLWVESMLPLLDVLTAGNQGGKNLALDVAKIVVSSEYSVTYNKDNFI